MRVKIATNPPLPPVRAWFSLTSHPSTPTISSFKSLLCTSLSAFRDVSPSSLRLSIDDFELLDNSELAVLREGDLICVDVLQVSSEDATVGQISHATQERLEPAASRKRKRRMSTPSSTSSESESESESDSESSDSESASDSEDSSRPTTTSLRKAEPRVARVASQPGTFVPPGYGKPQTRSRNLRRRLKRMDARESDDVSSRPASGTNAVVTGQAQTITPDASWDIAALPSLSLRNKNKARNIKSLMSRPLPPKIIFCEDTPDSSKPQASTVPRLIPPSSRSSLPPNLFVTSIDVEAGLRRRKKNDTIEDVSLDYGKDVDEKVPELDADRLEGLADKHWATLERPTSEKQIRRGMIVGYKALGINPATHTPEQCLTVGRVASCDGGGVVVRPLRGPVAFGGPIEPEEAEEEYTWDDIINGDWRMVN